MKISGYFTKAGSKIRAVFYVLCAILCINSTATAQSYKVDPSYVVDQWTVEDGLPVNNVVDILQAKNGYLWLATFDGLVRFDGVDFVVYQSENYPGLPTNRILKIEQALDGSIWMKTEQGFVVYYKEGKFFNSQKDPVMNGALGNEIVKDKEGVLWIASTEGIFTYDGVELKPYQPDRISGNIQYIYVDKQKAVWYKVYEEDILIRTSEEQIQRFSFSQKKSQEHLTIYDDSIEENVIWVGKVNEIHKYIDGTLIFHSSINKTSAVTDFSRDPDGNLWLADNSHDAFMWDEAEKKWVKKLEGDFNTRQHKYFRSENGAFWFLSGWKFFEDGKRILDSNIRMYSYLFDREGSLWVGSRTAGLLRLKKNLFKTYSVGSGLPWRNVYSIIESYDRNIWVGTYRSGTAVIDKGEISDTVRIENTVWGGYITSLFMGKDSTIYAGSIGAGLSWISPGEEEFNKERNSGTDTPIQIKGFFEDKNGRLWLGTPNGLFIGNVGNWEKVTDERFTNFWVRMITEAPDGSLWLGTNGAGIVNFKNDEFTFYGTEQGFTSNLFRSFHIGEVKSPDNYVLWVGTEDLGLVRVEVQSGKPNLETLTRYGTQTGMLDYAIHSIQEDRFGYFWMNSNRGIFRVAREQLEQFHRGEIDKVKGISFSESDGLINREGNGGNQSPGITASDGRIWFANQAGAVVFNPADFIDADNEQVPPVIIEEIKTDLRTIINKQDSKIELSKGEREFEINFTALSLVAPEKNNFRYRLVGLNDEWQETNGVRTVYYTNIPHGRYTFEVTASNNTGNWNPEPAAITLSVAPYFYETFWFRLLVVLLIVFILLTAVQLRLRSLKQSELKLKRLVNERTKELEEEKEKTQEQANKLMELDEAKTRFFTNISHELRTPLTLIMSPLQEMLSTEKEQFDRHTREEFDRMLRNSDRLLRLIDQTMELTRLEQGKLNVRVQKIDLKNFVEELVELFKYADKEKGVEVSFFCKDNNYELYADPDKLDKIIANLISNAIKFTPRGGKVSISIAENDEHLEVIVIDTGIGISSENIEKIFDRFYQVDDSETRFQEGSGIGLSLVKDFVELHHGELFVESELGAGTKFKVHFKKGKHHFSEEELTGSDAAPRSNGVEKEEYLMTVGKKGLDNNNEEDITSILLVEDNVDLRNFIQKLLKEDYRVFTASNGREALEIIADDLPDLIVADIMMPNMDGITFNRKLKEDRSTASIPLIFLTAKSAKEHLIKGLEEGGDAYLTKPFDPGILKARIKNLLETRYRLRESMIGAVKEDDISVGIQKEDHFVRKVHDVVTKNFMDPEFSVSRLAEELYMDRSQVFRKLKESSEMSPSQFIKSFRMKIAMKLLDQETENISEVAYATGFKSLSYFSYSFKEHFNMTPSEFLQQKESNESG